MYCLQHESRPIWSRGKNGFGVGTAKYPGIESQTRPTTRAPHAGWTSHLDVDTMCQYCMPNSGLNRSAEKNIAASVKEKLLDHPKVSMAKQRLWQSPDALIDVGAFFIDIEVDEEQHKGSYYSISCEQTRSDNITYPVGTAGCLCPGESRKKVDPPLRDRKERLLEVVLDILEDDYRDPEIIYRYYDATSQMYLNRSGSQPSTPKVHVWGSFCPSKLLPVTTQSIQRSLVTPWTIQMNSALAANGDASPYRNISMMISSAIEHITTTSFMLMTINLSIQDAASRKAIYSISKCPPLRHLPARFATRPIRRNFCRTAHSGHPKNYPIPPLETTISRSDADDGQRPIYQKQVDSQDHK
ncbi:hypothetical protein DFS34DRAFT_592991 [Phlyctochytrium arcticum]|nr:hypothetical protein DFS34DRAFT_592991 [Phlyctochytrium arcticum]